NEQPSPTWCSKVSLHGTTMTVAPIPPPRVDGFATRTAVPLYWREDGPVDADPLVLLHGGPGASHEYLYPQCLALAKTHRVFTYDQRGGGQSKTDDREPITWRTQVHDLAALVTEFRLAPLTLVGYSWGGLLAMLYAIEAHQHRELMPLSRLVLISPAPITRSWRNDFEHNLAERGRSPEIAAMREELNDSALREHDYAAYRHRAFELSVAGYFSDPRRAESLTPFRVMGRVQQSIWESLGDFDLSDSLRAVAVPVLVVHGRQDPIPLASAEAAAKALKGELVVLDDCGHVPYVEQPEALFASIEEFLSK
ncbi:MAG: alpha/beta hydrolase, partial [Gemmatimonadota bacterium]|nr:alpha/beta hydrolase [Gemmatimonadota bacterium]